MDATIAAIMAPTAPALIPGVPNWTIGKKPKVTHYLLLWLVTHTDLRSVNWPSLYTLFTEITTIRETMEAIG